MGNIYIKRIKIQTVVTFFLVISNILYQKILNLFCTTLLGGVFGGYLGAKIIEKVN